VRVETTNSRSTATQADVRPSGVEGWLTAEQAAVLAGVAGTCPADGTIVEIGSFRGLSTIVLAAHAPNGVAVVAIDPHAGNDRGPGEIEGYTAEAATDREAFERNLVAAGVRHRVRHVSARSVDAHGAVNGDIDVLYVDGAHRYAPARTDLRDWGRRVRTGGTLLVHDAFSSVGVTAAIMRELVFGGRFRYVGRCRSLAEYRADLEPGPAARIGNTLSQLLQLGWFARNLAVKLLLTLGAGKMLRRFGRVPTWPY
jgi:predicted O-methyltransferase YrrM